MSPDSIAAKRESGSALALLHEVAALLERLALRGESASIDLRGVPPGDRAMLIEMLGEGEVQARVQTSGATEIRETAFPGAWWVTHLNENGQVIAEFIDICSVPEILRASPQDVAEGLDRLRPALKGART